MFFRGFSQFLNVESIKAGSFHTEYWIAGTRRRVSSSKNVRLLDSKLCDWQLKLSLTTALSLNLMEGIWISRSKYWPKSCLHKIDNFWPHSIHQEVKASDSCSLFTKNLHVTGYKPPWANVHQWSAVPGHKLQHFIVGIIQSLRGIICKGFLNNNLIMNEHELRGNFFQFDTTGRIKHA